MFVQVASYGDFARKNNPLPTLGFKPMPFLTHSKLFIFKDGAFLAPFVFYFRLSKNVHFVVWNKSKH